MMPQGYLPGEAIVLVVNEAHKTTQGAHPGTFNWIRCKVDWLQLQSEVLSVLTFKRQENSHP